MSFPNKPKIGILGTGNMGRALGIRFAHLGHPVFFGGRKPDEAPLRAAELANNTSNPTSPSAVPAQSGTISSAASFGSILIWTMRERNPRNVLAESDLGALAGKTILDLNNRDYANEVLSAEAKWFNVSLGEQLQANLPDASVIKAFNTIPMETLDTSVEALREAGAQAFIAGGKEGEGKDEERAAIVGLIQGLGFEVVDLGTSRTAMRVADAMGDVVRFIMIDAGFGATANLGIKRLPDPDLGSIGPRDLSGYQ